MPKIFVAKEKDILDEVNLQSTWAPVSFMGYKDRVLKIEACSHFFAVC